MTSGAHSSFEAVHIQLLITIFLAVLLWTLYQRLRKVEFFRWWAWAWTASAVFLATAIGSARIGPVWTPVKMALLLGVLGIGTLQPLLLALGGLSWHVPRRPLKDVFWVGVGGVIWLSALAFILGFVLRTHPDASFAVRNLPRAITMIGALVYCCYVFLRQWRAKRSWAALMSGAFCLLYAVNQACYATEFADILRRHFSDVSTGTGSFNLLPSLLDSQLFFLDLVDICGICLGMSLLMVEQSLATQRDLEVSERRRLGLAVSNVELQAEIDERQRVERALRESEERVRQILQGSPVAMLVHRMGDDCIEFANRKYTELFGYAPETVKCAEQWWPLAYPDPEYRATIQAKWSAVQEQLNETPHESQSLSARVRCADGSDRDIEFHVVRVGDANLISFVDVTFHKRAEEALRESETKFRLVAEMAPCAIWILADERLVYVNRYAEIMSGYSREELISLDPWELLDPEFREEGRQRSLARMRGEMPDPRYQFKIRTKAGELRWLDFSGSRTQYEGRAAVLATAFDITRIKQVEQQLRERNIYLDALIANSPFGIVTKDEQGRVLFCNRAFEEMFLYSQGELKGKYIDDMIAPHDHNEAVRMTQAVRNGGVIRTSTQRRRKDGRLIDVELHGIRIVTGDRFIGAFAIYQDISERRRSEEKLQALRNRLTRAQEEERSRIARDLHDDIGQRLALLSIDLEQIKLAAFRVSTALARELETLGKTAGRITSDVHNVSRRLHPSQVELLGLAPALNNFCREFGERNGMQIQFAGTELTGKLQDDAALCLFRVAQEAIRNVQKHSGCAQAQVELDELSGSLRLKITDQGAGFDPTSAESLQGLGLLSMEERLRSIGGELFVHSRPGSGTCIEACVPVPNGIPA